MYCKLEERDGKWYCPNCNGRPLKGNYDRQCGVNKKQEEIPYGPGTELKKLLRKFRIFAKSCACDGHAREMDKKGSDWCEKNI